jgi:hypothetical protein
MVKDQGHFNSNPYTQHCKSTNMVVYFDWKMVIYIYVCGQCHTQFMLPNSSRRQLINMYFYNGKVSHIYFYDGKVSSIDGASVTVILRLHAQENNTYVLSSLTFISDKTKINYLTIWSKIKVILTPIHIHNTATS